MSTLSIVKKIITEQLINNGIETEIEINEEFQFLGKHGLLDSLDLAVIITELSEELNKDPFEGGFENFQSVGDLIKLYE
ncbi:MAG: hypothetical protein P8I94_06065 [Emcibacteraceae bacterium]|nr:hypothetical protein [Emcibacteraceae bacterium]